MLTVKEKYERLCEYLFQTKPTDDVIEENAAITIRLVDDWLGRKSDVLYILLEVGPEKYHSAYLEYCEQSGAKSYEWPNVPEAKSLFTDRQMLILLNLCALGIEDIQKLVKIDKARHAAYNSFINKHEERTSPGSIAFEHFLFGIIQNQAVLQLTLEEIEKLS